MKNIQQWRSTITGIITIILSVLVGFGILSTEDSEQVTSLTQKLIEGLLGVAGSGAGIYQIFWQKDK